jgi:hypothetical protein
VRGVSVIEIAVAAMVLGCSGVPVLELIRSSTTLVSMSETEVAVRGFATDVLQRFAGPPHAGGPLVAPGTEHLLARPIPADLLIAADPYLARGLAGRELESLLRLAEATVSLAVVPPRDPALAAADGLDCIVLTVAWTNPGERRKEVTLASLVAH